MFYKLLFLFLLLFPTISTSESTVTAFFVKEYISRINKICIYNLLGSEYIITIKNTELCPLTIKVKR